MSEERRARAHASTGRPLLAGVLTLVLLAATLEIVLDGAVGHSPLIPKSPDIAAWLAGIGERLGYRVFLIALLVLHAAPPRACCCWRGASPRAGRSR